MLPEPNFRIHTLEADMTAIVLTRPNGIKPIIVKPCQSFPPLRLLPYPLLKGFLYSFLLLLGYRCFLPVQNSLFYTVLDNRIKNANIPQVQRVLNDFVSIYPARSIRHVRLNIVAAVIILAPHIPSSRILGVKHLDRLLKHIGGIQQLKHESPNVL
ncbi:hypothetical protein D3C73_989230 [compost metagenome]